VHPRRESPGRTFLGWRKTAIRAGGQAHRLFGPGPGGADVRQPERHQPGRCGGDPTVMSRSRAEGKADSDARANSLLQRPHGGALRVNAIRLCKGARSSAGQFTASWSVAQAGLTRTAPPHSGTGANRGRSSRLGLPRGIGPAARQGPAGPVPVGRPRWRKPARAGHPGRALPAPVGFRAAVRSRPPGQKRESRRARLTPTPSEEGGGGAARAVAFVWARRAVGLPRRTGGDPGFRPQYIRILTAPNGTGRGGVGDDPGRDGGDRGGTGGCSSRCRAGGRSGFRPGS